MNTVSVIIPVYNREQYIGKAIESVLDQALPPNYKIEVIVIDDGSNDNTKSIVKNYPTVIYKSISNSGRPAVPRNIGIKLASGNIVAFQDSDDIWAKNKIIKQLPVFKDRKIILSYGNAEFIDAKGDRSGIKILGTDKFHDGYVYDNLIEGNFISTLTVMARKSALLKAGIFDESWRLRGVEDYELWLRMSLFGDFKHLNDTLAYYRQHDQNISPKDPVRSYENLFEVYRSLTYNNNLSKDQFRKTKIKLLNTLENITQLSSGTKKLKYYILTEFYRIKVKFL